MLVIIVTPALTFLGWLAAPDVFFSNIRVFFAVFGVCWGVAFYFLRKTAELTALPGLSVREREKLTLAMIDIRTRARWIAAVTVVLPLLILYVMTGASTFAPWVAPILIGTLVGVGLSYLIVLFGWLNETYAFSDRIKLREARKDSAEKNLKRIADARKNASHAT